MTEAVLGLGTNMGNRIQNINNAIKALSLVPGVEIVKVSNYYETEPFGVSDKQDKYINCCVRVSTINTAHMLLGVCLGIEAAMGRERIYKFCPRIIDIDVLAYGNECINSNELIIPHPRIKERAFVMLPLDEVCLEHRFGVLDFGLSLSKVDKSGVKLISKDIL